MRRTKPLLSALFCAAALAACAGPARPGPVPAQSRETALACTGAPLLRPGDILAVSPLWAPSELVKSPSYQLRGVIVELHPGKGYTRAELQTAIQCRSACADPQDLLALPGLRASLDPSPDHPAMILRSDDPIVAREAMHRAELLLPR